MNKIARLFFTGFALVGVLTSCHLSEEVPPPAKEISEDMCEFRRDQCYSRVSIYSLIASPKDYNGLPIVVFGYMGIDWNDVFLFPDILSYEGADAASSIQLLHDDFSDADHHELEKRAGNYVAVYGEFSTTYDRKLYRTRVGGLKLHGMPEYRGGRVPEETSKGIVRLIIRGIPELDE